MNLSTKILIFITVAVGAVGGVVFALYVSFLIYLVAFVIFLMYFTFGGEKVSSREHCPFCEMDVVGSERTLNQHLQRCSGRDAKRKLAKKRMSPKIAQHFVDTYKRFRNVLSFWKRCDSTSQKNAFVCQECFRYGVFTDTSGLHFCKLCNVLLIPLSVFMEETRPHEH